jgi:hypothetical protein
MATDEEVEAQRDKLTELRARLDEAKSGGSQTQRELDNEIALANMRAEEERLLAQIAEAEAIGNTQKVGARAPLTAAKEQMRLAVSQREATEAQADEVAKATAPPAPGDSTKGSTKPAQNTEG